MRALIVDDENLARDRLKRLLEKFSDVEIVGEASDGLKALEEVERLKPDVIFLDIEMPELDGLSVADAIKNNGPSVIFVTAYNEHALKAFEVSALDYIVKPINEVRLEEAIKKLRARKTKISADYTKLLESISGQGLRRFAVKCGAKFVVFDPSEISAIIARDHYAAIILKDKEFLADDSIESLIERLNPQQFIRIHRGAAINVGYLKELEREGDRKYVAVLSDPQKTRVPVARERLAELKSKLGLL